MDEQTFDGGVIYGRLSEVDLSFAMDESFISLSESLTSTSELRSAVPDNTLTQDVINKGFGGKIWRVTIIESGVSDNGNWYRPHVLKEAVPLFEGAPVRLYHYDGRRDMRTGQMSSVHHDHMPGWVAARDGGSVTGNSVGAFRDVKFESVPSLRQPGQLVPAITANMVIIDPLVRSKLVEAWNTGLMDPNKRALFELSIEAEGPHIRIQESGREIKRVEAISLVREVTIVSRGAAGGRVLDMLESSALEEALKTLVEAAPTMPGMALYLENFPTHPKTKDLKGNPKAKDKNKNQASNPPQSSQTPPAQNAQQTQQAQQNPNQNQQNPKNLNPNAPNSNPNNKNQEPDDDLATGDPGSGTQGGKQDKVKQDFEQDFDKDSREPEDPEETSSEEQANEHQKPKNNNPDEPEIKSDEDITNQDVSQLQKAIRLLRAGNLDLGIEILEDVAVEDPNEGDDNEDDDDQEDEEEEEEEEGKTGAGTPNKDLKTGNLLPKQSPSSESPSSKKLKRESTTNETELSKMPNQNQEPQTDGSEKQESAADLRDELTQFARFMAERDAQHEARLGEALELVNQQNRWREAQEEQFALRECQAMLGQKLRSSGLPTSGQALIAEEYDGSIFLESDLDASINRQINYTRKLTEAMGTNGTSGGTLGMNRVMESAGYSQPGAGYGVGGHQVSVGRTNIDWVEAEFDRAFGYNHKLDTKLHESDHDTYRQLPAEPSIRRPLGVWHDDSEFGTRPGYVGPNAFVDRNGLLREATSGSSGLAVVLQNSMTKALLQQFAIQPALWREIADTEPVANYLEQQRIVLGGLGRLPQVVESDSGSTYLRLGIPSSDQMKYTIGNFGGLICVTRQAIINDNLQVIQAYPQQAAESAIMTLNLTIFGTAIGFYGGGSTGAINTATSYDGVPLFDARHNNYQTAALAYDALVTALNQLSNQRKFGNVGYLQNNITSGDSQFVVSTVEFATALKAGDTCRIEAENVKVLSTNVTTNTITITGTFASSHTAGPGTLRIEQLSNPIAFQKAVLLVPIELRATAYTLLSSALKPGSSYAGFSDVSFLAPFYQNKELLPLAVHSMYLQDDLNNWYLMADKPVRVGFLGGREDPQLLLQDNPLVNNVFSGDLLSWKIFQEYGATAKGHLMSQASIVP